jgi:two-component system chemotaxis sensor kinase CheA
LAFEDWGGWKERRSNKGSRSVLLVDDAAFFRNMLAPILKAAGYAVTAVASAREAMTLLERGGRFVVVVADLEMPQIDGFDLAEMLRANPDTADLPVIGLSSAVSAEAIERGKRVGLHDYVGKFDRHSLIAALKEQTADMSNAA